MQVGTVLAGADRAPWKVSYGARQGNSPISLRLVSMHAPARRGTRLPRPPSNRARLATLIHRAPTECAAVLRRKATPRAVASTGRQLIGLAVRKSGARPCRATIRPDVRGDPPTRHSLLSST